MNGLAALLREAEVLASDLSLSSVRSWKACGPGRLAIGYLPIYVPREVLWAAGALPVGVVGAGDGLDIIKGDAYFQSYICHLPRSVVELGLTGRLDVLDGMLFPSICDVLRNLSGMWKILFPGKLVRYLDLPQNFAPDLGGRFYIGEMRSLADELAARGGRRVTDERLAEAIRLFDRHRSAVARLYAARARSPECFPTSEVYAVLRAGLVLPPDEHEARIDRYLELAAAARRPPFDGCRIVVTGAFCEQPPMGLIRTLEHAGCSIVDDDFLLGTRWHARPVAGPSGSDPWEDLARAYLEDSAANASRYEPTDEKGAALVRRVRERRADGVLLMAPSFCHPALLEQPMLLAALERAGVPHTEVKYAENTGQFQVIGEQAGTFSDSIRLWGGA